MAAQPKVRSAFEAAVAVARVDAGRYRAAIDGAWDGPAAPNGGVLAAMMVRAAEAELGAQAPPARTIAAQFLDAPGHGPVQIGVEVLRGGKRVAVCDARMRQAGRLIAQMTLVCSAARPEQTDLNGKAPKALAPESTETVKIDGMPGAPPIFGRVENRPTFGSGVFAGAADAVTGGWLSLRDDGAALDAARLCALSDLWWPAIFGRLTAPAAVPTLQLTVYLRSTEPPPAGPVLARFESRHLQEGHVEERGELWSADGKLLAESQQLALLI